MTTAPNWIEVSPEALAANYRAIQQAAGRSTEVLAVIKANAYGHGAELCGPILVRAGARWLGVTCAAEGMRVRRALQAGGLQAEILIMSGSLPRDVPAMLQAQLTPVVWTAEQVHSLGGSGAKIHIEIDTGMARQGVLPGLPLDELLNLIRAKALILEGLFTHFSSSETAGSEVTARQQRLFEQAVRQTLAAGWTPSLIHAGNSSAVDNPPQPGGWLARLAGETGARSMVRTGLALYGLCLPIEGDASPQLRPALTPVLTWKASILSVRALAPGDTVGYNATYTAREPMQVALLPVGYADGLRRELSSTHEKPGGWVMIHGSRTPILGRISMNLTVVDVTGIPGVRAGEEAVLLGPGVTAEDHASVARTIPYEILCGIHPCA